MLINEKSIKLVAVTDLSGVKKPHRYAGKEVEILYIELNSPLLITVIDVDMTKTTRVKRVDMTPKDIRVTTQNSIYHFHKGDK